jgi:hypothetical protein
MSASLRSFRFCFFGLAPSRETLLLAPIVRTRFQFVVLAGVAIEENDLLFGFTDLRHLLSPIHEERNEPFEVGIVVLTVSVRIRPASNASIRTLDKDVEVILCACPSGVSLRCHWNKERAFDLTLRRNRYLTDLHRSVEPAEVNVERYFICRHHSVVCDDNGSLESALWRAVRITASLNRDGENGRVRFEKEITRQGDLLSGLIPQPQVDQYISNRRARKNRIRHGVWTSGIALAARAFWTGDAEAPASSDASAPSYGAPKDVRIFAVVEPKLKLVQVQRQVLLRDMMVGPDYATLQQAPKRIQVLSMNFAAYILTSRVLDGIVRESEHVQVVITLPFVRRDQINFLAYGLTHKAIEGCGIGVLDHLADDVALTGDRTNDRSLVATQSALTAFLIPVPVLVLSTHIGFVYFNDSHEFLEVGIGQSSTEPMTHKPRRAIRTGTDHPMDLQGADALFAGEHQVQDFKPDQQLVIRVLEDRPADDAEAIVLAVLTEPMKRSRVELVDGGIAATQALHAVGPAMFHQISLTGGFIWEEGVKVRKRHLANELWFTFLPRRVHEKRIAQMDPRVKSGIFARGFYT